MAKSNFKTGDKFRIVLNDPQPNMREILVQLKQAMLMERMDAEGDWPSWGEMADADSLISDEDVQSKFADTVFTTDDFWI